MNWTPDEIKKLVKKFGGVAVMAEIMRVTPHSIRNMIAGDRKPSSGAGIALLNLINLLEETLSEQELFELMTRLREKNEIAQKRKTPRKSS